MKTAGRVNRLAVTLTLYIKNLVAIALKFSQSVVAILRGTITNISKPKLFNWKLGLISKETAVFAPHMVVFITVATIAGVCT